ncbi:MAG: sensor histidine kinase [Bacteroidetes bacterium]|nr:sensor histidine kinase [Bacteroidota bacterium]
MKSLTPKKIASLIAVICLLVFLIFLSFIYILDFRGSKLIIPGLVGGLLLFALCFYVSLYVIERFIYRKIKVIYKTIHSMKINGANFPDSFDLDTDILNQVSRDVVNWTQSSNKEIEDLKSQEQYRKDFIGNVSHELKTPLFNIQGYVLTLLEGGLEDETINRNYLIRAERSVERMINIVEDLDTVTKLETGQLVMDFIKFDIVDLSKDVVDALQMNAKQKGVVFKIKKDNEKPVLVKADKDRIRQVLTNLMLNSIRYGKKEGLTEIRFYDMEENILIEVADNGIGIPAHHLAHLFERFYRVDKSRSRESGGSGLGLAIVKHIIEAHDQTINVRSTEGVGSTFSFTLKKIK